MDQVPILIHILQKDSVKILLPNLMAFRMLSSQVSF